MNRPFQEIRENMSPEELESYKQKGEAFFSNFDFDKGEMTSPLENSARHLLSALRSGLTFEDLDDNEKEILHQVYGKSWKDYL
jgi:hypothetical protein